MLQETSEVLALMDKDAHSFTTLFKLLRHNLQEKLAVFCVAGYQYQNHYKSGVKDHYKLYILHLKDATAFSSCFVKSIYAN